MKCGLPSLDVKTRWSPTFNVISKAHSARRILSGDSRGDRVGELKHIRERKGVGSKSLYFLKYAEAVTENPSGSTYITLSSTNKLFNKLLSQCNKEVLHPGAGVGSFLQSRLKFDPSCCNTRASL